LTGTGALLTCSLASPAAPVPLAVTPKGTPVNAGTPVATIEDYLPGTNIPSFGMCTSPTNPAVVAATAAKMGAFTPAPCVPAVTTPWMPGSSTVKVGGVPALHQGCQATCAWGGLITIASPGNAGTVEAS
jgi:uncharacterized Zn-binding protein involved in type VI secretion